MPDRPPRFRTRSCRRVLCSILAILCLTSSIYYIPVLYKWSQGPHSNLFQTLEVPYKLDEVVRPVVDSTQTFDIVATVWVKDEIQKSGQESRVVRLPIFSGTIFRGLRLQDKNVKTAVNFSLPVNVLYVFTPHFSSIWLIEHSQQQGTWIPIVGGWSPRFGCPHPQSTIPIVLRDRLFELDSSSYSTSNETEAVINFSSSAFDIVLIRVSV